MTHIRSSHPFDRARAGYTLVEMMIVTTVLGVVTVMATGHINDYIRERNVVAATAAVRNDLQQAFSIAARNRRPVRISFVASDTAIRVTDRDNTITYLRRGLGAGSGFMLRPSDVAFCTSSCDASIEVFPNGWASDTLVVRLSSGEYTRGFHVSRSGLVTTR
jgi:prepilin-type N-terminal cleavage/methylation domain-containing protein